MQNYLIINIPEYITSILEQCLTINKTFNFQYFNKIKTKEVDNFLTENNITSTQLFRIWYHNVPGIPLCITCGKRLDKIWVNSLNRPTLYCSRKCQSLDPENREKQKETWKRKSKDEINSIQKKIKKTCLEKYGTESYFQTEEFKEQYKQTCLEKYGTEYYSQTNTYKEKTKDTWNNKTKEELDLIQEKTKQTNLEKYGTESYFQTEEFKEQYKQTCLEKYGTEYYSQTEEYKERIKQTSLKKYSTENTFQSEEVKERIKETCLDRYGVEWISKSDTFKEKIKEKWKNKSKEEINNIQEKIKQTCLERYGVNSYSKTDEYKEKYNETCLEKYGTKNPFSLKEIQEKYKQTCLDRYGVEWATQANSEKERRLKIIRKNNFEKNKEKLKHKHIVILSNKEEYINDESIKYHCEICGTDFLHNKTDFQHVKCPVCLEKNKSNSFSMEEKNILGWIKSIYNKEIIENDRIEIKPKELDIYIPEKKLAIEFNGDYWHSDNKVGKKYHQEKTLLCREKGIRLIHIFEYEWTNKQEICKSIIKSALGIYDKRIYARNCTIKSISSGDYRDFLDINHLQGSINSSIRYGLFYQDELVAVIGFGKSRFKKGEIELHRFCSKLGYHVIGGFSKLIKHSNIQSFITYVDLAHFSGEGYKKLGFEELSITEPNYKWIKNNIVLNRFSTQKHKLKDLLENYDDNLTEIENMDLNGFNQIYDSGNLKIIFIGGYENDNLYN